MYTNTDGIFLSPDKLKRQTGMTIVHEILYRKEIIKNHHIDIDKYIEHWTIHESTKILPVELQGKTTYYFCYGTTGNNRLLKIRSGSGFAMEYEAYMQKQISKYGYDPESSLGTMAPGLLLDVHLKHNDDRVSILIMSDIGTSLISYLYEKQTNANLNTIIKWLIEIFDFLCKNKFVHGDLHWGNIFYVELESYRSKPDPPPNNLEKYFQPLLIDFGKSSKGRCNIQLEVLQLLRTLYIFKKINPYNRSYLEKKLLKYYTDNFGPMPVDLDYDEFYRILDADYQKNILIPKRAKFLKTFKKYKKYTPINVKDVWPYSAYMEKKLLKYGKDKIIEEIKERLKIS